jgi:hypothetical protein
MKQTSIETRTHSSAVRSGTKYQMLRKIPRRFDVGQITGSRNQTSKG